MPPLESSVDSRRCLHPQHSPSQQRISPTLHQFGRRTADWTRSLLQQRNRMPETSNSQENVLESLVHPSKMRRNSTESSFVEAGNTGTAKEGGKHHAQSPGKRKRTLSKSLPIFLYTVILSVLLIGYTEFQLWQMSGSLEETHDAHGINVIVVDSNNQTHSRLMGLRSMSSLHAISQSQHPDDLAMDQGPVNAYVVEPQSQDADSILHIVHSRFMQNQPNLLHLGEARLHLFRHFFIASLQQQSSRNFCCIIRTDPALHPILKEGLIGALKEFNITHILVASNEVPKSQYQDVKDGNINASNVWSGSLEDVRQYLGLESSLKALRGEQSAAAPRRIIETRLDADDGLHAYFVATLQNEARENFKFASQSWRLWCISSHAEWQYQSLWDRRPPEKDPGSIVALQVNYCVTPGLSIAFLGAETSLEKMPSTMKHEKLMHTRMCSKDAQHENKRHSSECRSFVPMIMGALRARTPTSAGMLNLVFNGTSMNRKYISGATKQKDIQGQLWWAVRNFFGFSKDDARSVNQFLNRNMKMIAQENLEGQCTRGHSCKNSSQIILRSIVEGSV